MFDYLLLIYGGVCLSVIGIALSIGMLCYNKRNRSKRGICACQPPGNNNIYRQHWDIKRRTSKLNVPTTAGKYYSCRSRGDL